MDTLPLDHNPVPGTGTRNITLLLAVWLRRMGFAVVEHGGLVPTALTATWTSPRTYRYELSYVFAPTGGVLRLVHNAGPHSFDVLIEGATVHRLREARFLLLSSVRYDFDRKVARAAGTLRPTYAPHTD
jgi:hypothetical protein